MELNKLLLRQLSRLNIATNSLPPNLSKWQEFLEHINRAYTEEDQERYLLERSMEISSRELFELNKKLELAQQIGKLGYWEINFSQRTIFWSRELYLLHGLDPRKPAPNYEQFLKMIHPEDRAHMQHLLERAIQEDKDFENELRIQTANEEYHWFHTSFHRVIENGSTLIRGTALDITDRKKTEQEIESLHQQVIQSARSAGMADITASTLHNIGNVLNNANVSVNLLREYVSQSEFKKFHTLMELLTQHKSNLGEYLSKDPQGKLIPEYLIALLENVNKEYDIVSQEIDNLSKNLARINDIIVTQNAMSQASGLPEQIFLPQLIDAALEMTATSFEQHDIHVEKEYQDMSFILIDKVKLLQILINLIRNAKDALVENLYVYEKKIIVSIQENKEKKQLIITVKDNGIGILPENLTKIFSLGFTTKEKGHGLGLHVSALNAKDLGGTLFAESEGIGTGAVLTLTFPKIEAKSPLIH